MIRIDIEYPVDCEHCPLTYYEHGDDVHYSDTVQKCVFDNDIVNSELRKYTCPLIKEAN